MAVPPKASVSAVAHIKSREEYDEMYTASIKDPDAFWSDAAEQYYWHKKWTLPVSKHNFDSRVGRVFAEWFTDGETNLCYNAVDRHVEAGHGSQIAFYWEGNDPGDEQRVTYEEVLQEVCRLANYLKSIGVGRGDDVTIYLPMLVALPVAMLACARIGAVHSVVFAGFSAKSLANRILDSRPKVLITATGVKRGVKFVDLKSIVDEALGITQKAEHDVTTCLVFDHSGAVDRGKVPFQASRDVWWQDVVPQQSHECPVEWLGSEDPSFKLYTSGSTGNPKGVLHTVGGYMIGTGMTFKYVFDYHDGDIYWCTADCGWITGHSYVTYGPMLNKATQIIFEGIPTYPNASRCWEIVDKYGITQLYTAPTAIRSLMCCGNDPVTVTSRKSLKVLGTVGEPINPEAWKWYYEVVGNGQCPIVDTWWQTETGAHMITPLPGATTLKPGSATLPFFGVEPIVLSDKGEEIDGVGSGLLAIKRSWPSMFRTLSGDHTRYENTYFGMFRGYYLTGDGCRRDEDNYIWITGRVDDVINVSGHRIGSAEIESALVSHPLCSEAAVVPVHHDIKGQGIYAFVTLMEGCDYPPADSLKKELIAHVRKEVGPIATLDVIHWAPALPKTRSGKIMRRILRKIASKEESQLGDVSTLADTTVISTLIAFRQD